MRKVHWRERSTPLKTLTGNSDFNGTLAWTKPAQSKGDYPAAINANLEVIGSLYLVAKKGSVLPGFTGGTLELSDTSEPHLSGPRGANFRKQTRHHQSARQLEVEHHRLHRRLQRLLQISPPRPKPQDHHLRPEYSSRIKPSSSASSSARTAAGISILLDLRLRVKLCAPSEKQLL